MTGEPRDGPGVVAFLRRLAGHRGRETAGVGGWMLVEAALEGGGLLLLVPLLGLVGLEVGTGATAPLESLVGDAFERVGVEPSLIPVLGAFVLLALVQATLSRHVSVRSASLQALFVADLRKALHAALSRAPWASLVRMRLSDFEHGLTEEADRAGEGVYFAVRAGVYAVLALVTLAFALLLSPMLTALVVGSGAVVLLVLHVLRRRVEGSGRALSDATRLGYADLEHHLAGAKLARAFGTTEREVVRFQGVADAIAGGTVTVAGDHGAVEWKSAVLTTAALAVVVFVAVDGLALPAATLLLLLYASARLLRRVGGVHRNLQYLRSTLPSFGNVERLRTWCESEVSASVVSGGAPSTLGRTLRVEGVIFDYGRGDGPALDGVDLVLEAGTTTALVGPSGAGKTTLVDVVIGLLEPSAGRVLVDDRPRPGGGDAPWRRSLGYVPQDPFLFHESVRENLLWARPEASDTDLERALRRADALDLVRFLPEGLETVVGERGASLSGGERQRLALARALVRDPDLLILDEATSNLDSETEARIRRSIEALHGETTVLLVAHRLSTVRNADRIVVLEQGRVVEQGTWDELVARPGGALRRLADAQGVTP